MTYLRKGHLWTPTRNIWVPRCIAPPQCDISPAMIGGIAASRRRSATSTVEVGVTTEGASSATLYTDYLYCLAKFTASQTGNITSMVMFSANTSATLDVKVGIYTDSGGSPAAPVSGSPTEFVNPGTWTIAWKEFGGLTIPVTSGNVYWIAICVSENSVFTYRYEALTSAMQYISLAYGNAWPNPYGTHTDFDRQVSIKGVLEY